MAFKTNIMKKILLITFLFTSLGIYSQGNLQFNKTIKFSYHPDNYNFNGNKIILETITIPANKVWKLTSVGINNWGGVYAEGPPDNPGNEVNLFLNDINIYYNLRGDGKVRGPDMPIWLGPGTYDVIIYKDISSTKVIASFTGIEFNLVN